MTYSFSPHFFFVRCLVHSSENSNVKTTTTLYLQFNLNLKTKQDLNDKNCKYIKREKNVENSLHN